MINDKRSDLARKYSILRELSFITFLCFPTQADKTEAITGQVAYHILSVVKQKPSGRTKCKIKMNWNFK